MKNILVSILIIALMSTSQVVADTYYHDPGLKVGRNTTPEEYQKILRGNSAPVQRTESESSDYGYDDYNSNENFRLPQLSVASDNSSVSQGNSTGNSGSSTSGSIILPSGALETKRVAPTKSQSGGYSFSDIVESVHGTSGN